MTSEKADAHPAAQDHHEKCTRQHAVSAARNAKCHSSRQKEGRYSAKTATSRSHDPKTFHCQAYQLEDRQNRDGAGMAGTHQHVAHPTIYRCRRFQGKGQRGCSSFGYLAKIRSRTARGGGRVSKSRDHRTWAATSQMQAIPIRATRIILAAARNTSNKGSVAWQLPPADRRNLPRVRRSQSKFRSMSNFGIGGNSRIRTLFEEGGG